MATQATRAVPSTDVRPPLGAKLRLAAWGLAVYAAVQLAGVVMARNAIGAAAVQAALAEWGSGRLLVTWSDPHEPMPSASAIARRALRGSAFALLASALVVAFALATRAAVLAPTPPKLTSLALTLISAACLAVRDELLLHGLILRVLAGVAPRWMGPVACGLASAGAAASAPSATPSQMATAGLAGVAFGALWVRDRGAWMAWGAHATWLWATSSLLRGGLLDVRAEQTVWGGGDAGVSGGLAAIVVLGAIAAASVAWASKRDVTSTHATVH